MPKQNAATDKQTVILLHGIGQKSLSMKFLELVLRSKGYATKNITYPSTQKNLDGIVAELRNNHLSAEFMGAAGTVHFVAHSMGGLVTRRYLETFSPDNVQRVVMLGTPNNGSEIADFLGDNPAYQKFFGPAGQELKTSEKRESTFEKPYEIGIVAGSVKWPYPVSAFILPGAADGRVSVESTKLPAMRDHVVIPVIHSILPFSFRATRHVLHFLKKGHFHHKKPKQP